MNKVRMISILAALAMLIAYAGVSPAAAEDGCASSGSPMVGTDQADYGPFETATITGSGFGCGEVLSVLVIAPDGSSLSGDGLGLPGPDSVTTNENGFFVLSYQLSGSMPDGSSYMGQAGNYTVQVLNSSGTILASAIFSDGMDGDHSCALTTSGGVKCWGLNNNGQLGDGTTTERTTPVDVSGLTSSVSQISAGSDHTCALTTSGGVKCWGNNAGGKLGDGTIIDRFTPVDVSGLTSGVAQISAGINHTCALTTSGGVKCWGGNVDGSLGDGTTFPRFTPVDVVGLTSGVAHVSAGGNHTCALITSGGIKCWGSNGFGQLGDGTTIRKLTPVDVFGLTSGVAQIGAGNQLTCALTTGGGAKCWGRNIFGMLGDGTTIQRTIPVDVSGLTSGVAQISASFIHTCAVTTSGGAKCWGNNQAGELGDGTTTNRLTPVDVSGLASGVAQISAGRFHSCGLTVSGGVKCWGNNGNGQLGIGTSVGSRTTPVDVVGLTSGVAALPDVILIVINQPPTANAGGPYFGNEGAGIPMSSSTASDPDPSDILAYSWSVNSTLCSFDDASLLNPTLTCSDNGSFTATLSIDDGNNPPVSSDAAVTVDNVAPAAGLGNNGPIDEGGSATISFGGAMDPSSDDTTSGFHYAFECSGGSLTAATYAGSGMSDSTSCVFVDDGSYTVSGKIMDKDDGGSEYATLVTVNNAAPVLGGISVSQALIPVNTAFTASASFTDQGTFDTHTASWDWGNGVTAGTVTQGAGFGSVSDSHSYSVPGVYTLRLIVTDNDGALSNESVYQYVVVYDPNSGFVSGAGRIWSMAGACQDAALCDPAAEGNAIFGFVSKYHRGASVPTGDTHFRFQAGGLSFNSESYEWLVVNQGGGRAQFKGSGQVNRELDPNGNAFKFMVWAVDGSPDTFRIRIWWDDEFGEHVVYDNGFDQAIDSGKIVVHR